MPTLNKGQLLSQHQEEAASLPLVVFCHRKAKYGGEAGRTLEGLSSSQPAPQTYIGDQGPH